jgi:hypothetical protein
VSPPFIKVLSTLSFSLVSRGKASFFFVMNIDVKHTFSEMKSGSADFRSDSIHFRVAPGMPRCSVQSDGGFGKNRLKNESGCVEISVPVQKPVSKCVYVTLDYRRRVLS